MNKLPLTLSFDLNLASVCDFVRRRQTLSCVLRDVNFHCLAARFHARRRVYAVAEKTISGHFQTDNSCNYGARVHADPDSEVLT